MHKVTFDSSIFHIKFGKKKWIPCITLREVYKNIIPSNGYRESVIYNVNPAHYNVSKFLRDRASGECDRDRPRNITFKDIVEYLGLKNCPFPLNEVYDPNNPHHQMVLPDFHLLNLRRSNGDSNNQGSAPRLSLYRHDLPRNVTAQAAPVGNFQVVPSTSSSSRPEQVNRGSDPNSTVTAKPRSAQVLPPLPPWRSTAQRSIQGNTKEEIQERPRSAQVLPPLPPWRSTAQRSIQGNTKVVPFRATAPSSSTYLNNAQGSKTNAFRPYPASKMPLRSWGPAYRGNPQCRTVYHRRYFYNSVGKPREFVPSYGNRPARQGCSFCFNANLSPSVVYSHSLFRGNQITCRNLLTSICKICFRVGHTGKYCPMNPFRLKNCLELRGRV